MACKEELLNSICPTMKLTKDFFKRIYGYELTYPGFADQAISKLEATGCSNARRYYDDWVSKFEADWSVMMKNVANWYVETYGKNVKNENIQKGEKIWDLKNSHPMKYTEKQKEGLRLKLLNRNLST